MRCSSRSLLIATAYFALRSHALPRPATPSYSVVAVDGGQNSEPAPTTIVQTVTDSESSQTTVSVTVQETQAPSITTVLSTEQAPTTTTVLSTEQAPTTTTVLSTEQGPTPPPQTITINGEVTTISAPTVVIPGSRTSYTTTAIVSHTTTVVDAEHTTVFQQGATTTVISLVTPSTSYFDDGMWHTSYGRPVWPTKFLAHKLDNQTTDRSTRVPRPTTHLGRP